MIRRPGVGSLLVVALAAACGSSPRSDGGTTGALLSPCLNYATTICNLYADCSAGWYVKSQYGTLANCETRNAFDCAQRLAVAGTALTSADVAACSDELLTESCAQFYGPEGEGACAPFGAETQNQACEVSAQCETGLCEAPDNSFCGTCQSGAAAGDQCSSGPCAPGLLCLAVVQTCSRPLPDGGACHADADCQFGLSCLSSANVCAPAAAAGMPCDLTGRIGPSCNSDLGLVCQPMGGGGMCQPKPLAQPGQPCGQLSDSAPATVCANRGVCQEMADAGTGVCLGVAGDEASCDVASGPNCELPARCLLAAVDAGTAGTCQILSTAVCGSGGN